MLRWRTCWEESEASGDSKLDFGEMETLCKRLNVNALTDALMKFVVGKK